MLQLGSVIGSLRGAGEAPWQGELKLPEAQAGPQRWAWQNHGQPARLPPRETVLTGARRESHCPQVRCVGQAGALGREGRPWLAVLVQLWQPC